MQTSWAGRCFIARILYKVCIAMETMNIHIEIHTVLCFNDLSVMVTFKIVITCLNNKLWNCIDNFNGSFFSLCFLYLEKSCFSLLSIVFVFDLSCNSKYLKTNESIFVQNFYWYNDNEMVLLFFKFALFLINRMRPKRN